ncbi:LytR/AlgR family response regulator transcription factor [Lysinibacillus sp. NPDC094403]|uniref:LytR/AlgR family response regulator transcription factor n=1 Tax=Lysinibacillus sp. NPDC094403 TaxID=3390581 RepID=UPI003D039BF0
MVSALLIEDNVTIQQQLQKLINYFDIPLIGVASSCEEAKQILSNEIPSIIFCDIHLPDSNAFTLMQQIKIQYPYIGIVFITGYTEFAHKAYDIEAIDYLIKPFDQDRFYTCMKKVYAYLNMNKISRHNPIKDILPIKNNNGIELLDQKNIVYIRAEGKVSKLIVIINGKNKVIQISESLKSLETKVDSDMFMRTHRSFIVNLNHINRIESSGQTNLIFFKTCSDIAYLSKNYMLAMYQKLNFK